MLSRDTSRAGCGPRLAPLLLLVLLGTSLCHAGWNGCPAFGNFRPVKDTVCLELSPPSALDDAVAWCEGRGDRYNRTLLQTSLEDRALFGSLAAAVLKTGWREVWVEAARPYDDARTWVHSSPWNELASVAVPGNVTGGPDDCLALDVVSGALRVLSCNASLPAACLAPWGRLRSITGPVCPPGQRAVPSLGAACFQSIGWPRFASKQCNFTDEDPRVGFVLHEPAAITTNCSVRRDSVRNVVEDISPEFVWSKNAQVRAHLAQNFNTTFLGVMHSFVWLKGRLCLYCQTTSPPLKAATVQLQLSTFSSAHLLLTASPHEHMLGHPRCFTDALAATSRRVLAQQLGQGRYKVASSEDGYYWCLAYDALSGATALSDRALVRQRDGPRLAVLVSPRPSNITLAAASLAKEFQVELEQVKLKQDRNAGLLFHVLAAAGSSDKWPALNLTSVRNTRTCQQLKLSALAWPETNIGNMAEICSDGSVFVRKCSGDFNVGGVWERARIVGNCTARSTLMVNASAEIDRLSNISMQPLAPLELNGTLATVSDVLELASSDRQNLSMHDLAQVLDALDRMLAHVQLGAADGPLKVVKSQLAVLVLDIGSQSGPVHGFTLRGAARDLSNSSLTTLSSDSAPEDGVDVAVMLQKNLSLPSDVRVAFAVFADDGAFSSHEQVNSLVLGITLTTNGTPWDFPDGQHIDILFRPLGTGEKQCTFWNMTEHRWASDGCQLISTSRAGLDTCRCHHLTHFAQIVTDRGVHDMGINLAAMEVVSVVGCALSLLGLLGIAITAIFVRRWRKKLEHKVLLNMTAAVALNMAMFLATGARPRGVACIVLGALLHYSVLSSLCWMLVSAAVHYLRFTTLHGPSAVPHFLCKASLLAWGAPLLAIAVLLGLFHNGYAASTREFCYPTGAAFYITVLAPIAIMLVLNATAFVLILYRIDFWPCCRRKADIVRFGVSERKIFIRKVITSIFLFFLFGLTWVFGVLSTSVVAAYLFCIFATLQGFVLFIFFVLGEQNARRYYGGLVPKKFKGRFRKFKKGASESTASSTLPSTKVNTSKVSKGTTTAEEGPRQKEGMSAAEGTMSCPQPTSSSDTLHKEEVTFVADVEPEIEPIIQSNPLFALPEQSENPPMTDAEWVVSFLATGPPSPSTFAEEDDEISTDNPSLQQQEGTQNVFVVDDELNGKVPLETSPFLCGQEEHQKKSVIIEELDCKIPLEIDSLFPSRGDPQDEGLQAKSPSSEPKRDDKVDEKPLQKRNPFSAFVETLLHDADLKESYYLLASERTDLSTVDSIPFKEQNVSELPQSTPKTLDTLTQSSPALEVQHSQPVDKSEEISLESRQTNPFKRLGDTSNQWEPNPFKRLGVSLVSLEGTSNQWEPNPFKRLSVSLVSLEDTRKQSKANINQHSSLPNSIGKRRTKSESNPFKQISISEAENGTCEWQVDT